MNRSHTAGAIAALIVLAGAVIEPGAAYAAPAACQPATLPPADTYPGTTVAAANFESGSITGYGFGPPVTSGTGTADVASSQAHSGGCAVHLHVTTNAGSTANFAAPLPSGSNDVHADGWFNITQGGAAGNNVPYFRFFNGSTRIVDVFRDNGNGNLVLRVTAPAGTFTYTTLTRAVPLSTWHHLVMHVVPNGAATTVEIFFDEKAVFSSNQVVTGFTALTAVQLGAEHPQQAGDIYIDDVIIKSGKVSPRLPGTFTPVTPTRILDTRSTSPVAPDSTVSFQVAGVGGIPASVAAVVFNLTVTEARSYGFVTAYASGSARPNASNLNFLAGQTVPNLVTVPVGPDGKVTLFNRSAGTSQLIADVAGYYLP